MAWGWPWEGTAGGPEKGQPCCLELLEGQGCLLTWTWVIRYRPQGRPQSREPRELPLGPGG